MAKKAKPERGPAAPMALVLAGFLVVAGFPDDRASIRIGGVSLLWWYGAAIAPALLAVAAVACPRRGPAGDEPSSDSAASAPPSVR